MTMEPKKVFLDTDHHVYSIEDLMGRGAQGNIYKGIHKVLINLIYSMSTFELKNGITKSLCLLSITVLYYY